MMHTHGAHAPCRTSASKYCSGLSCMQADPNLEKITASHFQGLGKYPKCKLEHAKNMIAIAYLNENFMDCNENLAWGK